MSTRQSLTPSTLLTSARPSRLLLCLLSQRFAASGPNLEKLRRGLEARIDALKDLCTNDRAEAESHLNTVRPAPFPRGKRHVWSLFLDFVFAWALCSFAFCPLLLAPVLCATALPEQRCKPAKRGARPCSTSLALALSPAPTDRLTLASCSCSPRSTWWRRTSESCGARRPSKSRCNNSPREGPEAARCPRKNLGRFASTSPGCG